MSAAEMTAALDAELASHPGMRDFKKIKPRCWVSFRKEPIRELVEFLPARYNAYFGNWGFALAFCPSLSAKGKFSWKRTEKATRRDLWVDAHDNPPFDIGPYRISYATWSLDHNTGRVFDAKPEFDCAKVVVGRVVSDAVNLFDMVRSFRTLSEMFEIIPSRESRRFGPDNYVPHGLAWGLTQIAAGDTTGGLQRINEWCRLRRVEPTDRLLVAAIELAEQHATKPEYVQ